MDELASPTMRSGEGWFRVWSNWTRMIAYVMMNPTTWKTVTGNEKKLVYVFAVSAKLLAVVALVAETAAQAITFAVHDGVAIIAGGVGGVPVIVSIN